MASLWSGNSAIRHGLVQVMLRDRTPAQLWRLLARRYLQRDVPAGSLPALLAASAVLALQRLILPVVHWFDDARPFGSLRPWRGSG